MISENCSHANLFPSIYFHATANAFFFRSSIFIHVQHGEYMRLATTQYIVWRICMCNLCNSEMWSPFFYTKLVIFFEAEQWLENCLRSKVSVKLSGSVLVKFALMWPSCPTNIFCATFSIGPILIFTTLMPYNTNEYPNSPKKTCSRCNSFSQIIYDARAYKSAFVVLSNNKNMCVSLRCMRFIYSIQFGHYIKHTQTLW